VCVGFIFPSLFITQSSETDSELARQEIRASLFLQAIIGSVILILVAIFFKNAPPSPPSPIAIETDTQAQIPFMQGVKGSFTNRNSLFLLISFGILNGTMNTLGTIIGIIAGNYGYSTSDASLFGATFIVGGFIGSGVFGTIVELRKNYKVMLTLIAFLSIVLPTVLIILFAYEAQKLLVATGATLTGFAIIPVLAVAIDFAAELTYPIPPQISSGLMFASGNTFGIIMTLSSLAAIDNIGGSKGNIIGQSILVVFAVIAFIFSLAIEEDLKR